MEYVFQNDKGVAYAVDEKGWLIDGVPVTITLSDVGTRDLEEFLDYLSEEAGFPLLTNIEYRMVDLNVENQTLTVIVQGDTSMCADHDSGEGEDPEVIEVIHAQTD
jgi:hypothetical protein